MNSKEINYELEKNMEVISQLDDFVGHAVDTAGSRLTFCPTLPIQRRWKMSSFSSNELQEYQIRS